MPLSSRDCVIFVGSSPYRQVLHRTIDSHLNNQGLAFIRNDRLVGQTDDVVGYCFFLSHLTGLLVEVHNKSVSLVTPMRSLEKLLYLALVVSVGCRPLEKAQICENGEIVLENGRAISWKTRDGDITVHREIAKSDGLILCATRSEDCLWFSYTPDSTKFSVQSQVGVFYRARAREQKLSIQGRITEIAAVDCNVCYFVVNDPEAEVLSDQLLLCHVEGNSGLLETRYIDQIHVKRRTSMVTKSLVGGMDVLLCFGEEAKLVSLMNDGEQSEVKPVSGWTIDSSYTDWFGTFLDEQKQFAVVRVKGAKSSSAASKPTCEFRIELIDPVSKAVSSSSVVTSSISTDFVRPIQITGLTEGHLAVVMSDGVLLEIQKDFSNLAHFEPPQGSISASESVLQAVVLPDSDKTTVVYSLKDDTGRTRTIDLDLQAFVHRKNSTEYLIKQNE